MPTGIPITQHVSWRKQYRAPIVTWGSIGLIALGIFVYYHWYIPYRDKRDGFVIVSSFDCPSNYPIKAHLGSMIYHDPGDPYYARTSASNGYCFDTNQHAATQGFRAPYNL